MISNTQRVKEIKGSLWGQSFGLSLVFLVLILVFGNIGHWPQLVDHLHTHNTTLLGKRAAGARSSSLFLAWLGR